ncbi:MAG: STAS domain-containing protein [Caulobacteraceae bacterium]|nr:STAS domain-containing protein [Caulobacteraceae bacterium]
MTASVVLAPVLDILQADPLRAELLALRGQPVSVDASAVERLGGLCLQILISADQTWSRDGQALTIDNPSEAFATQWNMFGAALPATVQGEPA